MAIKDSIISDILRPDNDPLVSKRLYKRLRPDLKNEEIEADTKPYTNRTQSAHKQDTQPYTNRTQIKNKPYTTESKKTETVHKPHTQPYTEADTNRTQTVHKPHTDNSFSSLVGLQRAILIFLFNDCKITRSHTTQEMSLQHVADSLKITLGSVKTTFFRLVHKGFIKPIGFKNGRGGWRKYEIPDSIYKELMHIEHSSKLDTNRTQSVHKQDTQPYTQPYTAPSSSSSFLNNKTTTTEAAKLNEEWQNLEISPLEEVGFTITHLTQIAEQGKLTPEIVQDSIYAFAFDLKHNNKGASLKGAPLNFFMGILRNGNPYAPAANYESPQDREMRIYLERKKKIEADRTAREDELIKLAFAEWEREQSEEAKQALLPEEVVNCGLSSAKTVFLRTYFTKEIWPKKKKEIESTVSINQENSSL